MDKSILSLLTWAESQLSPTSRTPRLDAEVLLGHRLGVSRSRLLTRVTPIARSVTAAFQQEIGERASGKPVAYLVREKEFYGRAFFVDERVLVPRPETELLVELALQQVTNHNLQFTIVDLGTGSGNIIVTIAAELKDQPNLRFIATDTSAEALAVAQHNAEQHGLLERITFLEGSLLDPLLNSSFDIRHSIFVIVANLPYVADHWVKALAPDIKYFEPHLALAGGPTGLELYRQLFGQLRQLLMKSHGLTVRLYVEHDPRQAEPIRRLSARYLGVEGVTHPDLAGLPRVLEIAPLLPIHA